MAVVAIDRRELALLSAMGYVRAGWTQGAYWRNANGSDCEPHEARRVDLAHALGLAAEDHGVPEEELRALVLAQLDPRYRDDPMGLERWNDVRWRSRTDVILVLERTLTAL